MAVVAALEGIAEGSKVYRQVHPPSPTDTAPPEVVRMTATDVLLAPVAKTWTSETGQEFFVDDPHGYSRLKGTISKISVRCFCSKA